MLDAELTKAVGAGEKVLVEKYKQEREKRLALKDKVIANKSRIEKLEEENRLLLKKCDRLRNSGGGSAGTANSGTQISFEELEKLVSSNLDDENTRSKVEAYHGTFEKKAYNHVWSERIQAIMNVLETGERDLSRALAKVRRFEERSRNMGLENRRWVINDAYMELPWCPAAAAYRSAVVEAAHAHIRPDTTKIIETGSGWGEHLCNIYLEGGPDDAVYYALEMEEEGRKCSLLLAALEPAFQLEAHFFDYRFPDYSPLPKDDCHTLLLTCHSIEQVKEIHEDCIRSALELGEHVTGIHFEPVGWQTYPEDKWSEASVEHHKRCVEKDYNQNVWSILNKLQDEGVIAIKDLKTNFIGLDYNPATYIHWEKV